LKNTTYADIKAIGAVKMNEVNDVSLKLKNTWNIVCKDSNGEIKWEETKDNIIVNAGLDDLLDKYLKGSSYTAAWYVGLKGSGTAVAAALLLDGTGWVQSVEPSDPDSGFCLKSKR